MESGGVYGEDENKFVFNNVLVGATAKARFKIANTNKVLHVVTYFLMKYFITCSPTSVFHTQGARKQF